MNILQPNYENEMKLMLKFSLNLFQNVINEPYESVQ